MADNYIDFREAVEYGTDFIKKAGSLRGTSKIVNVEELIAEAEMILSGLISELDLAGVKVSDLRTSRDDVEPAMEAARDIYRRFYNHTGTIPATIKYDKKSFYPGGKLGTVDRLKPADMRNRLGAMLQAFAHPANAALPDAARWKQEINETYARLDAAVSGRFQASTQSITATAGLNAARERFLEFYNGVAKPIVRGLLKHLGRDSEYRLFFPDLQVNESSRATPATPGEQPSTTPGTQPSTGTPAGSPQGGVSPAPRAKAASRKPS